MIIGLHHHHHTTHSVENQAYLRKTTPPFEVFLYAFSWGVTKAKVSLFIYFYRVAVPKKDPTPGRSSLPPSSFGPMRAQYLVMWHLLHRLLIGQYSILTKSKARVLKIGIVLHGCHQTPTIMSKTSLTPARNQERPPRLLGGHNGDTEETDNLNKS